MVCSSETFPGPKNIRLRRAFFLVEPSVYSSRVFLAHNVSWLVTRRIDSTEMRPSLQGGMGFTTNEAILLSALVRHIYHWLLQTSADTVLAVLLCSHSSVDFVTYR